MDGITMKKVGTLEGIKKEFRDAEYVDAEEGVTISVLINTREHTCSAMARGFSIKGYDPKGFLDILDGIWRVIDCHLMGEQTRQSARVTYLDSIKNGVATVFDHHANFGEVKDFLFAIEDAVKEMSVRAYLCYEISDRDGAGKVRAVVMENVSWIRHILADDTGMIAGMMRVYAQFTISGETMELIAANKPVEVGYHIHVAEGIGDLHDCLKKYDKRIVGHLTDYNILGEKTLLAHCIYVNPHEIQLIRNVGAMVIHNSESDMGNVCGRPPTMGIVYRGILTGLGTDDYIHDMAESFKTANVLHEHRLCDTNAAWGEIPQMLFEDNARIANRYLKKQLGALKEGTAADVIVTDCIPLTPTDASNINGHILFGMMGRSVVTTVCNGKVLMKDRELIGLDEEKILYEVKEGVKKLAHPISG